MGLHTGKGCPAHHLVWSGVCGCLQICLLGVTHMNQYPELSEQTLKPINSLSCIHPRLRLNKEA